MRTWLFWRPHRPYGSIVFNHSRGGAGSSSSSGGALTTNIYTSWGAATVSDAIATVSETQSQLQKPVADAGNSSGLPVGMVVVETSGGLSTPVPGVMEKPYIVQLHVDHSVHFELQERPRSQVSALQQRQGAEAAQIHLQDQPIKGPRHSIIDSWCDVMFAAKNRRFSLSLWWCINDSYLVAYNFGLGYIDCVWPE